MKSYLECWTEAATTLLSQALAGEPGLVESLPKPMTAGSFGFAATLSGDVEGRFSVVLDRSILELVANAAAGDLLARTGKNCRIEKFEEIAAESKASRAFQLNCGERVFAILVRDETHAPQPAAQSAAPSADAPAPPSVLSPGINLLMDVELEVSLRFGCKELSLGEILDLGPGDVVQLDRNVSDPVDRSEERRVGKECRCR